MLAQNFKTAAELRLDDKPYEAHVKLLGMFERGEIKHCQLYENNSHPGFNMGWAELSTSCGTVACIGGWVATLIGVNADTWVYGADGVLHELYFPTCAEQINGGVGYKNITTEQAAIALRNYLTTGEPRWEEALQAN